ncbi:hypothetical protein JCM8208_005582 [Rhodotorula glutinis]
MSQGNYHHGKGHQRPPPGPSLLNRFGNNGGPPPATSNNKDRPAPTGPVSTSASNGVNLASRLSSAPGSSSRPTSGPASTSFQSSSKQAPSPSSSKPGSLARRLGTTKPHPSSTQSAPFARPPPALTASSLAPASRPPSLSRSSSSTGGNPLTTRLSKPGGPPADNRGAPQTSKNGTPHMIDQSRSLAQRLDGPSARPASSASRPSPGASSGAPPTTSSVAGAAPTAPLAQRLAPAATPGSVPRASASSDARPTPGSSAPVSATTATATAHGEPAFSRAASGGHQPHPAPRPQQGSASSSRQDLSPPRPAPPSRPPVRPPPAPRTDTHHRPSPPPSTRDARSSHVEPYARPAPQRVDPRPHDPLPRRDDYRPYHDYRDDYRRPYDYRDDYDYRYQRAPGHDADRDGRNTASRVDRRPTPPSRPAADSRAAPPPRPSSNVLAPVRGVGAPQLPDRALNAPSTAPLEPPPSSARPVAPPASAPEPAARPRPVVAESGTPPHPPPRALRAGDPPSQPLAMRLADAPATARAQQEAAQDRARQAQQAQPQPRPPSQPQVQPIAEHRPPPVQQGPPPPRSTQSVVPAKAAAAPVARAAPAPLASRIKPEPSSPILPRPSLAPATSSAPSTAPAPSADVKPLLGRLGPLPHAGDGAVRASPSADELRTWKERADELRAAEARAAELRKLEAAEAAKAAEAKEREERAERERREKERREADARRERQVREEEERQEKEQREAAEREKEKRRERERLEKERLEKELAEMERRRTDEMVEAARRVAEERAAAAAKQRAQEEKREADRVAAEERAAVEAAAAAAAADEQRNSALRVAEERAVAELRAAEAELREAEARAAARRASKERARSSAGGVQGAQVDRSRETTAEGLAREIELRRLVAERSRRAKSAARARDPAGEVEVVHVTALSDPGDGDHVMDEDDEVRRPSSRLTNRLTIVDEQLEPRTATTARTTSAPTWDAEVPPLQEPAPYDWAKPSPIPALAAIIARREEIFVKQRAFKDSELQRKSQHLIATKLAAYARSGSFSTFGYQIASFCSFCRAVDIPPWPATPPVFALFAHQVSYYATSSRGVLVTAFNMVHKVCRDLWDPLPAFKELLEWHGAQAAVIEWKKRAPTTPTKGAPADKAREPAPPEGDKGKDDSTSAPVQVPRGKRGRTIPQYLCPGLPAVGATFPSSAAAHEQVAAALIPVYGNGLDVSNASSIKCTRHGAGCPMRIDLGFGGGRWRVLESSNFFHNHERDSRIVKDPTWRPQIRNSTVRAAVEKRDEAVRALVPSFSPSAPLSRVLTPSPYTQAGIRSKTGNPKKRDEHPGPDPPPPKKQARALPSASLSDRPVAVPPAIAKPAAATAQQHVGTSTSTSTAASAEPAVPPPRPPPSAPSTASPAPPAPARRSGVTPSFHLPAPDPAAFLADLIAFLSALDPTLAPLAQPLHSAGISTLRDLRSFVQFEPATRMALYEDLHTSGGDAAMLDVDLVERLEEALVAAQASAWR